MVQDKDKLKEVGLEPDKPAGHIRAIWALTLILAFTIVIVGGVYFILWYSPWGEDASWHRTGKTADTSDWQTYENKIYDFSVKYPKDWGYKEHSQYFKGVVFYEESKKNEVQSKIWQDLTNIPGDIALNIVGTTTLKTELDRFASEQPKCVSEDKKIAGKDGKLLNCPIETSGQGTTGTRRWYLVENNNTVFELFTADDSKKDTLDKMIGTLTFGGATTSPTTTQLNVKYKTYVNSDLSKFSFEYPENLYVYPSFGEYGGTVSILKKGNDNVLNSTKIEVKVNFLASKTTDIRVGYKEINESDFPTGSNTKAEDATVGGVPALKLTYTDVGDMGYFFIKDDHFFEISAWTNRMTDEVSPLSDSTTKAAFDHLVLSFKF